MDTDQLIKHSRSRFDHEAAKKVLQEKYLGRMVFAHAEGLWRAGPELLVLLASMSECQDAVILDLYQNPIQVNVDQLRQLTLQRWQEQMNAWLIEHQALQKQR